MYAIKEELNLLKWPTTTKEVEVALRHHFLDVTNQDIEKLSLPALRPLDRRERMEFANELRESQVDYSNITSLLPNFLISLTLNTCSL